MKLKRFSDHNNEIGNKNNKLSESEEISEFFNFLPSIQKAMHK